MTFLAYLLEKVKENHDTGIPLVRAMVLEFQEDPVCGFLDRQYMLGDRYLVAPVMDETGEVMYYLPHGQWKIISPAKPDRAHFG